ncbi:MAG: hypothetical protein MUE51_01845 [Thermoleophilia bacterium]|jgi:hypothetical protein|nr:hypothetical protein [Thermoleophilia bacterium]
MTPPTALAPASPGGGQARHRWEAAGSGVGRLALALLAREVGRRIGDGRPDAGIAVDRLGALLEADEAGRAALETAVLASEGRLSDWERACREPPSPREARIARMHEVRDAVGRLVLGGGLQPDGPGRVCLPCFGPATLRALARAEDPDGAERRWARALLAAPAAVLGTAAPAGIAGTGPDPDLDELAQTMHRLGAVRQDLRDAMLGAEARAAWAAQRGQVPEAAALTREAERAAADLARVDAALDEAWAVGVSAAHLVEAVGHTPRPWPRSSSSCWSC